MNDTNTLQNLIRRLTTKDWKTRQDALQKLGELNNREATPYLVKSLKDRSVKVRRASISALVELNDPAVAQVFLEIFENTTDPVIFYMAARGLGKTKPQAAIE